MAKWNPNSNIEIPKTKDIEDEEEISVSSISTSKEIIPISEENNNDIVVIEETPLNRQIESPEKFNNLAKLQDNLNNCLKIIDDEVMKGYLTSLNSLPIVEIDEEKIKKLKKIQFFKITELVCEEEEFSVYKLTTLFNSLSNNPCTLVLMVKSDGIKNNFYLGVRSNSEKNSSATMMKILKESLKGLFPGSQVADYFDEELNADMEGLKIDCLSSVSCVADFKQKEDNLNDKKFIQGLEKFIDSMQGRSYQAIFIAENIGYKNLMQLKRNYESIYTQISPFTNMQLNFSTSQSNSTSNGEIQGETKTTTQSSGKGTIISKSEGTTEIEGTNENYGSSNSLGETDTTSDSNSQTAGHSEGTNYSESESKGGSIGLNINILNLNYNKTKTTSTGTNYTDSTSNSITKTLSHGITNTKTETINYGKTKSQSLSKIDSEATTESETNSFSDSMNFVNSLTYTDTIGKSEGIALNAKNMTLHSITDKLEKQLKRIEECESFGMWNFSAYFIGESVAETESPASIYHSVVSGTKSGIECSAINTWSDENDLKLLVPYVKNFLHPNFKYNGFDYDTIREKIVTPAVLASTNELSIQMGLPYSSVKGLPVIKHAKFAQEVLRKNDSEKEINLGNVYHLGAETKTPIKLDLNSLTMHTFISGSTGSGKSNTVYNLLNEAQQSNIPFLVVEPAKGEYKNVFPNVKCFGTNPTIGNILQINPFSFPAKKIHVLEHIDRLVEIFNACWPMYAAMPAVLKDSIENAYISAGWDIDESQNTKIENLFPTFEDVVRELNDIIKSSDYSVDTKGDYIGSLSTRLKSLTNGINGRIFSSQEIDLDELFNKNAIIDISSVGSMETKALIMGLVILKLQEFRKANAQKMNSELQHITILEEAHNILKKTSTEQSSESSNLQGKSVEMLANTIAEIRTYGDGFIIVDQAPELLDTATIRNTNTKIILRLPEGNDRKITGASMALTEQQIEELSKLPTGVACVYQNDWHEAVLCKLPKFESNNTILEKTEEEICSKIKSQKKENDWILHQLIKNELSEDEITEIKKRLLDSNISAKLKLDLISNISDKNIYFEWAVADFINRNYKYSNVFRGTSNGEWKNFSELADIVAQNIQNAFENFDKNEITKIMYYICRTEHEKFPENQIIEELRVEHLRKEIF